MSYFGVTLETLETVKSHPNADRLELGKLKGLSYQFVIPKDQYKAGDQVIYFPIDSILPDSVAEICGVLGKLRGKEKNRVGTVRLRGEISQGIVAPKKAFIAVINSFEMIKDVPEYKDKDFGEYMAETLGVEKYEAPEKPCNTGNLCSLPVGLSIYDIENAEREEDMLNKLMDCEVEISEKMEGSNFSVTATVGGDIFVNQRRHTIKPIEGKTHTWWRVAVEHGWIDFAKSLMQKYSGEAESITIYGEMLGPGVQKNYYNLKHNQVMCFDIRLDTDRWVSPTDRRFAVSAFSFNEGRGLLRNVPILSESGFVTLKEWLGGKTIQEKSNGTSLLALDKLREGIVIKPVDASLMFGNKRLFIKQRSPEYLEKND